MTTTTLDPVAAELAAAWETFREAVHPPEHLPIRRHFDDIVGALLRRAHAAEAKATPTPAPFVHGDPRVDRWQLLGSGHHPPNVGAAPPGFEPLAAWAPLCRDGAGFAWERPLRACNPAPAPTEESALAALLTAWDSWPNFRGHHPALLADLTDALGRAGLSDGGHLTETARAIVARAGERGRR
jgi:hypothetical protein